MKESCFLLETGTKVESGGGGGGGWLRRITLSFVVQMNWMGPRANQTAHPMSQGSVGPLFGDTGLFSTARDHSCRGIKQETIL